MKILFILCQVSAAFIISVTAQAGDKINNGGGLWGCLDQNQSLLKGSLIDLYEARVENTLNIISSKETDPMRIVQERLEFVRQNWPDLYAVWSLHLSDVAAKMTLVGAELIFVDDADVRVRPLPQTCAGTWEYVQFANFFTVGNHVLIRKDIWESPAIESIDKAALIWHEAVYAYLRQTDGDTTSVRTRRIVGYLFSNLSAPEIRQAIEETLKLKPGYPPTPPPAPAQWACVTPNNINGLLFLGTGISQTDAKFSSLEICQKETGNLSFHCSEPEIRCENVPANGGPHVCRMENEVTQSIHTGRGSSLLEAEANALKSCAQKNHAVHCQIKACD